MNRRILTVSIMAVVLVGCNHRGSDFAISKVAADRPDSAFRAAAVYNCVPSDENAASLGAATGGKSRRVTVTYDGSLRQTLLSLNGGSVNYLDPMPGTKGPLYANSKYAWKGDGKTGLLTDLAAAQTYDCSPHAEAGAAAPSGERK